MVYHPHRQFADNRNWALTQVVATRGPQTSILPAVRGELAAIDAGLVLYEPRMLEDVIGAGIAQERFAMLLIGAFAALAVALAAVGLYGVLSYAVTMRRREMAIRLALGANPGGLVRSIMLSGLRLVLVSLLVGTFSALLLARSIEGLLFRVTTTDPLTYCAVATVLAFTALLACYLPARRTAGADPVSALRTE